MGLRELHCSLARTNPGVPLLVLSVEGDLDAATQAEVESLGQLRLVAPIPWGRLRALPLRLQVCG